MKTHDEIRQDIARELLRLAEKVDACALRARKLRLKAIKAEQAEIQERKQSSGGWVLLQDDGPGFMIDRGARALRYAALQNGVKK